MLADTENESYTPTDFFGGEADVVTGSGVIASGNSVVKGEVLGRITASGKFAPWDADAADGSQNAVAIAAEAIDASTGDVEGPVYLGGVFNPDELTFDGDATDVQKSAAFDGTNIALRKPKHSGA